MRWSYKNITKVIISLAAIMVAAFLLGVNISATEEDGSDAATIENGYYRILLAANSNYAMDVDGANFNRGANVQLYTANGTDAQLWQVKNQADGYILILNVNNGLALDVTHGSAQNGTNIENWYTNHADAQAWKPYKNDDGSITLKSKIDENYVVDLANGTIADCSNIQLYSSNGSAAQKWNFVKQNDPQLEIPSFNISLNGTTLDEINADKTIKHEDNDVTIQKTDGTSTDYSGVRIKGRGHSSWVNSPKKPYSIKFAQKEDLFGLGKAKNWVLLANSFDASNMRNDVAFRATRDLELENSFDGQYVNLFIDNEYLGMYWLTHKVEINNNVVPAEDDGILVEMTGWEPEDIYFVSDVTKKQMELKDAKCDSVEECQPMLDSFKVRWNQFEHALQEKDWETVKSLIDVDSFVKYALSMEYSYTREAFRNSSFFYQKTANGKIYGGPVWDCDRGFGNWPEDTAIHDDPMRTYSYKLGEFLIDSGLMQIEEFRSLVEQEYKKTFLSNPTKITDYAERQYQATEKSGIKNAKKWGFGSQREWTDNLKNYITKRTEYLNVLYGSRYDIGNGFYNLQDQSGAQLTRLQFEKQSDGFYVITDTKTGKTLDVKDNGFYNDTPVVWNDKTGSDTQRWLVNKSGNKYYIISKITGLVLDTHRELHLYDMINSNTQLFNIEQTTVPTIDIADGTILEVVSRLSDNIDLSYSGTNIQTGKGSVIDSTTFKFIKNSDNTYTLQEPTTGLVIDVENGSIASGSNVKLVEASEAPTQKWILVDNQDGSVTIANAVSWKTLDVLYASTAIGNKIWLYEGNSTGAQQWFLRPGVGDAVRKLAADNKGTIPNGNYYITSSVDQNYAIDVSNGSHDDGANVQIYRNNGTPAQQWQITDTDDDGFLTIRNIGSGKVLDVAHGSAMSGNNVWQYSSNDSYAQKWIAVADGTSIKLVSALNPNLVLDLAGASATNHSNIQIYNNNDTPAQRWVMNRL